MEDELDISIDRVNQTEFNLVRADENIKNLQDDLTDVKNILGIDELGDLGICPADSGLENWIYWYNEVGKAIDSKLDLFAWTDERNISAVDEGKITDIVNCLENAKTDTDAKIITLQDEVNYPPPKRGGGFLGFKPESSRRT